jgi:rhodanese-related sulfurtransferase
MMGSMASATTSAGPPDASRDDVIRGLREGRITLVDVLSPESFARNHISGAINLPVANISTMARSVLPDLHAPIIVYCGGPT